jgi:hypothetical protein
MCAMHHKDERLDRQRYFGPTQSVLRPAFFDYLIALHHHTICFLCSYDIHPSPSLSELGPLL